MKIEIVKYKPEWKDEFMREKNKIITFFPKYNLDIKHIGSTSIVNMPAKPIIDILVGLDDLNCFNNIVNTLLLKENYIYFKVYELNLPHRRFFVKTKKKHLNFPNIINIDTENELIPLNQRKYHIHFVSKKHIYWRAHLEFKKIIERDTKLFEEYLHLKLKLSNRDWKNSKEYSMSKNTFITTVLKNNGII